VQHYKIILFRISLNVYGTNNKHNGINSVLQRGQQQQQKTSKQSVISILLTALKINTVSPKDGCCSCETLASLSYFEPKVTN
jgi:hypothetical protein